MAKKPETESTKSAASPTAPTSPLPPTIGDRQDQPTNKPEVKYGPFPGGFGVTVWRNKSNDGRHYRTITISPRRYQDKATGEWKDSGSFRPVDIQSLVLALQQVQQHISNTPLPSDAEEFTAGSASNGETPF